MSFLKKILGRSEPVARIRVYQECGMPVANHKEWCSILIGQRTLDEKATAGADS